MAATKDGKISVAENPEEAPILHFFRAIPLDLASHPPLASSLQSLETCFFLLALGRYPSALVACASTWESLFRARLRLAYDQPADLKDLVYQVRQHSANLRTYSQSKLDHFRRTRNRIVHYGFSPRDDNECARLLLETGLPFLRRCYADLFDFFLDWRDVRTGNMEFQSLAPNETAKVGLLPEVADHLHVAAEVYEKARQLRIEEVSYCFLCFAHFINLGLKNSILSATEVEVLGRGESHGATFDAKENVKERLEHVFAASWNFDCPVCGEFESLVAELNDNAIESRRISPQRCVCATCGLLIPREAPYLATIVLREQLAKNEKNILAEYGFK